MWLFGRKIFLFFDSTKFLLRVENDMTIGRIYFLLLEGFTTCLESTKAPAR